MLLRLKKSFLYYQNLSYTTESSKSVGLILKPFTIEETIEVIQCKDITDSVSELTLKAAEPKGYGIVTKQTTIPYTIRKSDE
jgi:hypothetical protein